MQETLTAQSVPERTIRKLSRLYPYAPDDHGIPFERILPRTLFLTEETDVIAGGSGRLLHYTFQPTLIRIEDIRDPYFRLIAYTEGTAARFTVFTKRQRSKKPHPDMFAGRFIGFSLAYFRSKGIPIDTLIGEWHEYSKNYREFMDAIRHGLSRVEAASQSWSGIQFTKLGYQLNGESDIVCNFNANGSPYYEAHFRSNGGQFPPPPSRSV